MEQKERKGQEEREDQEEWKEQELYTEYIPEDILREAGIYGERIAIEQIRFELYELESEFSALNGELAGMRKKWDGIKRSLRFSLIMLAVFGFLYWLMYRLGQEQILLSSQGDGTQGEAFVVLMLILVFSDVFKTLFFSLVQIFLARFIYKLYQFLSNYDSETSRRWCAWAKKKNLSHEIEQLELRYIRVEDRLRRLKQVRTMYRERKQEEWREDNLPERIAMERELAMNQEKSPL